MIAGLILAGGQSRRMGVEKALVTLGGTPLAAHVAARLLPQVDTLAVSANGDPARFGPFALPVLQDEEPAQGGPVAGLLAGLAWAQALGAPWLLTAPVDTPFLPPDLASRLHGASGATGAHAASGGRAHPVIALWPTAALPAIRREAARTRAMAAFTAIAAPVAVIWEIVAFDPFLNINTSADLARALDFLPS